MRRYPLPSVIWSLLPIFLAIPLVGCSGGGSDSDSSLVGGDTCTELTSGTWTTTGAAFGMGDDNPMDGDLTMNVDECSFAFDNWSMEMDDLPSGGVIDGDAVQLDGLTSKWRTCTGTATDATTASGTCDEDGTAWEIVLAAGG